MPLKQLTLVHYLVELLGLQPVLCGCFLPALDCFLLLHLLQLLIQSAQNQLWIRARRSWTWCKLIIGSTFEFFAASLTPPVSFVLLCRSLHPPLNNKGKTLMQIITRNHFPVKGAESNTWSFRLGGFA